MYLSVVITAGKTELLTCIGGWGGGKLYYGALDTPTSMTWTGPISAVFNGTTSLIDCACAPLTQRRHARLAFCLHVHRSRVCVPGACFKPPQTRHDDVVATLVTSPRPRRHRTVYV